MKGQIINQPDGKDVYNGTLKDYTQKVLKFYKLNTKP